jgi:hypothetical protein
VRGNLPVPTEIASAAFASLATTSETCHCESFTGRARQSHSVDGDCFGTVVPRNDRMRVCLEMMVCLAKRPSDKLLEETTM